MLVRKKALNELLLLWLAAIFCLSMSGCRDEAAQYSNRGIALWKKGQYDEAIYEFDKAIEMDPKLARAYYFRANVYYDLGRYSSAWDDVHRAEELGYKIAPRFLKILQDVSGRER